MAILFTEIGDYSIGIYQRPVSRDYLVEWGLKPIYDPDNTSGKGEIFASEALARDFYDDMCSQLSFLEGQN